MQVAYHIGAHVTDEDRLLKCLLKNKEVLRQANVAVPGPGRYRKLIRETLGALDGAPPTSQAQDALMDGILDGDSARRLVLSAENFICLPQGVFRRKALYALAGDKTAALNRLLPATEVEFHLAIRNPATFVPALFARSAEPDLTRFLHDCDPGVLRWSDMIRQIRASCPEAALTVWCNEDTPLIWSELLESLADLPQGRQNLAGAHDLLSEIMTGEGFRRFCAYLESHPIRSPLQKRRVIAAFLDKFAIEDQIEETIDIPGWDEAEVERITALYEEDINTISQMPDVELIEA